MQSGQSEGIPAIGLDALARPLRDQRGSDDGAVMPEIRDLPLQPIAGRPRLITEQQLAVFAGSALYQAPYRLWRMVDVAEEPHLALAARLRPGPLRSSTWKYPDRQRLRYPAAWLVPCA